MKLNTSGDDVKEAQILLKKNGYYKGQINGFYSQDMVLSVMAFQKTINVDSDGVIGIVTWNFLQSGKTNEAVDKETFDGKEYTIYYSNLNGFKIYDNKISDDNYYTEKTEKRFIFLHSTNAGFRPDYSINMWNCDKMSKLRHANHFVIGRNSVSTNNTSWDGKTLITFDDSYWAYNNIDDNIDLNKSSISIDICNYGTLIKGTDNNFYNSTNKIIPPDNVIELKTPYKGITYFEKYTDKQIESLYNLINYLINKHNIHINRHIYNQKWFEYNPIMISGSGIRTNGQVDMNTVDIFPQKNLIDMLNTL